LHRFTKNLITTAYVDLLENPMLSETTDLDYHWVNLADRLPIHTAKAAQHWLTINVREHPSLKQRSSHFPDLHSIVNAWALPKDRRDGSGTEELG
jgi:hypothetical protein